MSRLARVALIATMFVVVSEVVAAVTFRAVAIDRLAAHWRLNPQDAIASIDEGRIAAFRAQYYDAELGWCFTSLTTAIGYTGFDALGARRDTLPRSGRIAAYGDSFTFGEDVDDAATWPHLLGVAVGDGVANFGVAGYGPDQALLRLRRDLAGGATPEIVILGLLSENVARVVNAWRYLYTGGEILNFKPMWDVESGTWIPNRLAVLDGQESVARAGAAVSADYWHAYNDLRPSPRFPYILHVLDTAHYLVARVKRWEDLWNEARPVATLGGILDQFVALSVEHHFRPILLMIPMPYDLRADVPSYAEFAKGAASRHANLIVIDPLADAFDRTRFNQRPFAGHSSPYGNQILADALARALTRKAAE